MAERGVAVLAAAATTVGAATVVNAAVIGVIQLLFLQHLGEDIDDWVIARLRRIRDRRRAVRLQRRRRRVHSGGSEFLGQTFGCRILPVAISRRGALVILL